MYALVSSGFTFVLDAVSLNVIFENSFLRFDQQTHWNVVPAKLFAFIKLPASIFNL